MEMLTLRKSKNLALSETFDDYINKCRVRNLSESTISMYSMHFEMFKRFLNEPNFMTKELTPVIVDRFILYLRQRGCNDMTVLSYLRDIRAFLYYCMEEELIPRFKIKMPKAQKRIKETYTDEELRILLKKPEMKKIDFTEYKIWVFSNYLLATGNRISSVLDLKVGSLDFANGVIQVDKTKNRKAQIIPMAQSLMDILREYLIYRRGEADDYLFCNVYGGKGEIRTYQNLLYKYNRAKGVEKTSAHLYRHTFAKKWILNGGDIFRLQKMLGHSDLTIVREYVNMFGKDLSKDFELFNPLDNLNATRRGSKPSLKIG